MDVRYFVLCVFVVVTGCAETDYAMPCDDCAAHGLALTPETLVVSAAGGVEIRSLAGEVRTTLGPDERCSAPEVSGNFVSFACEGGSWLCRLDTEACDRLTEVPGRARLVQTRDALLAVWVGREGDGGTLRVFRVGPTVEPVWGPAEAFASSQSTRATHDAVVLDGGARIAWLDRGRRNVQCVDLAGDGTPTSEPRTWLSVDTGSLAAPLLSGERLFVTHRDVTDAVRSAPLPAPGQVAAPTDTETVAEGTADQPEVTALAVADGHLLLGRLRPDGADLSLLSPEGADRALGFGLGRPVACALTTTQAGFIAAWRDGAASSSHFDRVQPNGVVVREVAR